MTESLFSYGTLQLERVQKETFGRQLTGSNEILKGYLLHKVKITDPAVLATSNQEYHPIAIKSKDENDQIEGMLFEISSAELAHADAYEVADYKRILVEFVSGKKGWIYVKK